MRHVNVWEYIAQAICRPEPTCDFLRIELVLDFRVLQTPVVPDMKRSDIKNHPSYASDEA
jgi:hypothetical protein